MINIYIDISNDNNTILNAEKTNQVVQIAEKKIIAAEVEKIYIDSTQRGLKLINFNPVS